MVLGNKLGEKSRRERRKEARLLKKKKKFDSWTQHQIYLKLKKRSMDSNPIKVMKSKNPYTQSIEKWEVLGTDNDSKSHYSSEKLSMLKKIENRLDSSRFSNSTASKTIEGRKGLKKSKCKFKDYFAMKMQHDAMPAEDDLEMERKLAKKLKVKDGKLGGVDDDINTLFEGIPSAVDFFKEEGNLVSEEVVKRFENDSSSKKRKKRKSLEKGLEHCSDMTGHAGAMASDTDVVVSEPVETSGTKSEPEQVSANVSDLNGNVKYVAPHLRSRMQNESEEYCQIRRRIRGLLNRLSESNVESTTDEMSTIFRSVSRSVGSMIINGEVLASCSGGPRGNEQYAAVFAAFVAGMACVVGIDFGAKLLASLAKCFEEEYLEEDNLSLRNLTLLLSYLYVFGVCSSDLIYDFMIMLSKRLTEIDVSTILTVLQCCGMNLRGEDHAAMKSFMLSVQNRANELRRGSSGNGLPSSNSKRMEFMLETIADIKNNKKRVKGDTPQHTRMKKWLQKLRVEDIKILGLKWSKLLDPDKKGQWWLSGYMSPLLVSSVEEVARTVDKETLEVHNLLQLASAEGMNTDVRRSIFCVIMGAEDYMDAFEKLLRLNLRGKQDREIMRVLVRCCLLEQLYNKYYPILAIRLCSHDYNHKVTLKYCLWDHFKELESMELKRSVHLSKFVADMFASFTLSLAVLKVVDFTNTRQMAARRIKHFQLLFEAIFQHPDTLVWNIFTRTAANPDCESLRQGIESFINKYVVSSKTDSLANNKSKIVKKALSSVEGGAFTGVY